MKKSILVTLFYLLTVLLFIGCADVSPNIETCVTSDPYGFWSGLWHGMITPFSWVGSLFSNEIAIYAYDNNGGWYDFGFILGIGGLSLSSGRASK